MISLCGWTSESCASIRWDCESVAAFKSELSNRSLMSLFMAACRDRWVSAAAMWRAETNIDNIVTKLHCVLGKKLAQNFANAFQLLQTRGMSCFFLVSSILNLVNVWGIQKLEVSSVLVLVAISSQWYLFKSVVVKVSWVGCSGQVWKGNGVVVTMFKWQLQASALCWLL